MIEIEIYAKGIRDNGKLKLLTREMDKFKEVKYTVDEDHDIVFLEVDSPEAISPAQIEEIFSTLGLESRYVGELPVDWWSE
jgi:hypothetical protein